MSDPAGSAFAGNLVRFVRRLREDGLALGPGTTASIVAAVQTVGLADRTDLHDALQAVTVVRPGELPIFEAAFAAFFGEGLILPTEPETRGAPLPGSEEPAHGSVPLFATTEGSDDTGAVVAEIVGGSYAERLMDRDFADLDAGEAQAVRALVARMIWRPADAASRRWRPARVGPRPDLRRTFRRLTGPAGDLVPMAYRVPRRRRRPLVVLADISGSMERYVEMFLHFVHAAQGHLGRVETFVFATRLTRITRQLRARSPLEAIGAAAQVVDDWSGGTRIGEALATFNRDWSRRVTRGGAIGLVISDGWDTGDPELLRDEMARFARSVHRVVWLNPLAGREGYAPETRGMRTVLPYVDDLLAAGTLRDLRDVVRLLETLPRRRGALAG